MPHRKISRGPVELTRIIFQVAELNQLKDIDFRLEFGCDDVDCFYDGIYSVCIRGYRGGQKVRKRYIIKWHGDPKKRNALQEAHQREFLFYQRIAPKFLEIQRHFKIIEGLKTKFLNCEFASDAEGQEVIVISSPIGYKAHDRFQKLSLDHVSLAVKNLAQLHALSFVLEKSQPEEFEEIKKACYIDVQYPDETLMPESMFSYYNESVNVVTNTFAKKKLQESAPNILRILNKCAMPDSKYNCICHGDCWNNNILMKYQVNENTTYLIILFNKVRDDTK